MGVVGGRLLGALPRRRLGAAAGSSPGSRTRSWWPWCCASYAGSRCTAAAGVILVGALYGWLVEGVVAATVYGPLPVSLVWTGVAWHGLLTVGVGWWILLPRAVRRGGTARGRLVRARRRRLGPVVGRVVGCAAGRGAGARASRPRVVRRCSSRSSRRQRRCRVRRDARVRPCAPTTGRRGGRSWRCSWCWRRGGCSPSSWRSRGPRWCSRCSSRSSGPRCAALEARADPETSAERSDGDDRVLGWAPGIPVAVAAAAGRARAGRRAGDVRADGSAGAGRAGERCRSTSASW